MQFSETFSSPSPYQRMRKSSTSKLTSRTSVNGLRQVSRSPTVRQKASGALRDCSTSF